MNGIEDMLELKLRNKNLLAWWSGGNYLLWAQRDFLEAE